ncbi:major allergen I polypeptide chain 1-like [Diceros bicornis minor]|uniref:major allergen I polypeptide chain 1-like n=1 Tax=Diceros bicornis minor TaxID=77932 RepID=UPI0026EEDBD9|nr:major allergen I polypeptide chain 1-like [Diceros bicornis minor]
MSLLPHFWANSGYKGFQGGKGAPATCTMTRASALVLLCTALLLISGRNCDICPAVKNDVNIFLTGTTDEYINTVSKYQNNSLILANAKNLKNCMDQKLTEEDKENALNVLEKIYSSPSC